MQVRGVKTNKNNETKCKQQVLDGKLEEPKSNTNQRTKKPQAVMCMYHSSFQTINTIHQRLPYFLLQLYELQFWIESPIAQPTPIAAESQARTP